VCLSLSHTPFLLFIPFFSPNKNAKTNKAVQSFNPNPPRDVDNRSIGLVTASNEEKRNHFYLLFIFMHEDTWRFGFGTEWYLASSARHTTPPSLHFSPMLSSSLPYSFLPSFYIFNLHPKQLIYLRFFNCINNSLNLHNLVILLTYQGQNSLIPPILPSSLKLLI